MEQGEELKDTGDPDIEGVPDKEFKTLSEEIIEDCDLCFPVLDVDKVKEFIKIIKKDEDAFLSKVLRMLRENIMCKLPKGSDSKALNLLDNEINLRLSNSKRYLERAGPKLT